jgi:hypothetical protein
MTDFTQLRERVLGTGVVAVSNCSEGASGGVQGFGFVRRAREAAAEIIAILEGEDGSLDGAAVEEAALQLAWTRVLEQLVNASPEDDLKEVVSNIQKLSGIAPRRGRRGVKGAAGGAGLSKQARERISEVLRGL